MNRRFPARYIYFFAGVVALAFVHERLLRLMTDDHIAHVLLGAGGGRPPVAAALAASLFVLLRLVVIVLLPPLVMFVGARAAFHALRRKGERAAQEPLARAGASD